jgi:hypothetical protein
MLACFGPLKIAWETVLEKCNHDAGHRMEFPRLWKEAFETDGVILVNSVIQSIWSPAF